MGKIVGFDEIHAETWTIDLSKAIALNALCPEYHYYGHVSDLMKESVQGNTRRLEKSWDRETLNDVDVLVIAHPAESHFEGSCDGSPIFTNEEIASLREFVKKGGGLFVLTEWGNDRWGSNINVILAEFGIQFNNDTLVASKGGQNSHLVARHFQCTDINEEHPATDGVRRITYHRGCSLTCIAGRAATPLIYAPGKEKLCVFAVATYGKGRVAAIGDTDLFSIPFIGHGDNARLLAKTIQWLAGIEAGKPVWHKIKDRNYALLGSRHHADVSNEEGDHILDCSLFRDTLENLQKNSHFCDPYQNTEEFIRQAELYFHELPREIRRRIINFKRDGNKHGVLTLKGLPTDPELPLSPSDSKRAVDKYTYVSELWLAAVAGGLGDAISYSKEKDGEIFQNICPTQKNEENLSSESSKITLDFHTETAFHPFMPDFLMLYCLRPDHDREAQTFFAGTRHIVQEIALKYRAILFESIFQTGIDYSFGSRSGLQGNGPLLPVFYGNPYDPFMKFDLDLMVALNEAGGTALDQMKTAVNQVKDYVKLDIGDLIIIDNRRAVHGRSIFTPRYDGYDRWLQRVFVVRDLAFSEEDRQRGERIIDTEFLV